MDGKQIPIIDLFASIQGEGKYIGTPSIFIRTSGCNCNCIFKNSICDTPYSSFNAERSNFDYNDVVYMMEENLNIRHIVITGGEPLIHDISEFLDDINAIMHSIMLGDISEYTITVETNGTHIINDNRISLYSISPKLSNSAYEHNEEFNKTITPERLRQLMDRQNKNRVLDYEGIADLIKSGKNIQLKFVYSGKEVVPEIYDIVNRINKHCDFTDFEQYIYLMPEGVANNMLDDISKECVIICINNGWNFTDRLHIRLWGDLRGK